MRPQKELIELEMIRSAAESLFEELESINCGNVTYRRQLTSPQTRRLVEIYNLIYGKINYYKLADYICEKKNEYEFIFDIDDLNKRRASVMAKELMGRKSDEVVDEYHYKFAHLHKNGLLSHENAP